MDVMDFMEKRETTISKGEQIMITLTTGMVIGKLVDSTAVLEMTL